MRFHLNRLIKMTQQIKWFVWYFTKHLCPVQLHQRNIREDIQASWINILLFCEHRNWKNWQRKRWMQQDLLTERNESHESQDRKCITALLECMFAWMQKILRVISPRNLSYSQHPRQQLQLLRPPSSVVLSHDGRWQIWTFVPTGESQV